MDAGKAEVLRGTDVPQNSKEANSGLPPAARGGEIYLPRYGVTRRYAPFETSLALKLQTGQNEATNTKKQTEEAKALFNRISTEIHPQITDIIKQMKELGIQNDILAPDAFHNLTYAIKTDQLGDRQPKDYPKLKNEKYIPDPRSPLYEITVAEGRVAIAPETTPLGEHRQLNFNLQTAGLRKLLQDFYDTSSTLSKDSLLASNPDLRRWVEHQAIARNTLIAKGELKPAPLTLDGATRDGDLKDVKQASNTVEIWKTAEGKKLLVKHAPLHTLQAEVMENRLLAQLGVPVPETYIEVKDDEPILVAGFLDGYFEEDDPFKLSEEYHTSRTLQRGMIADLLVGQYNRRPHNVMMKDGKIAFIDHGAAAFCRATGGLKEFSGQVETTYMWDILRTIPDDNPNGDTPVNEAYANVLTVEGGPHGKLVIKDLPFLMTQVDRLDKLTNEQITASVDDAGYEDGPEAIEQMTNWINSDTVEGKITKLSEKITQTPDEFTQKDARDLRWTQGAKTTLEAAIAAGGIKSYMTETLIVKRDNLVKYLRKEIIREMQKETQEKKPENPPQRPEKKSIREAAQHPEMFDWDAVLPQLRDAQAEGKTIVVTNGHFVMMHAGHSASLEMAREVGGNNREDQDDNGVVLLAIVNADHQTYAKDPIKAAAQDAHGRAMNVYDNRYSDHVVISSAPEGDNSVTADFRKLAEAGIITDNFVYIKGGDYSADSTAANVPPEAEIVQSAGGKFVIVSREGNYSTSSEVDRMLAAAREQGKI